MSKSEKQPSSSEEKIQNPNTRHSVGISSDFARTLLNTSLITASVLFAGDSLYSDMHPSPIHQQSLTEEELWYAKHFPNDVPLKYVTPATKTPTSTPTPAKLPTSFYELNLSRANLFSKKEPISITNIKNEDGSFKADDIALGTFDVKPGSYFLFFVVDQNTRLKANAKVTVFDKDGNSLGELFLDDRTKGFSSGGLALDLAPNVAKMKVELSATGDIPGTISFKEVQLGKN